MNNNSPNYQHGAQTAPNVASGGGATFGTGALHSPQVDPRKQKRHYPRPAQPEGISGYQQQQFQPSPQLGHIYQQHPGTVQPQQFQSSPQSQFQAPQPISRYASPVPSQTSYNGGYNQALNGLGNMNLQQNQPLRQDVSLVGQPPAIQDFKREAPTASIPSNVIPLKRLYPNIRFVNFFVDRLQLHLLLSLK